MTDPLAQVVSLLRPEPAVSKLIVAGGGWSIRRSEQGRPFYCVLLEGRTRLTVDGHAPIGLVAGDFVLVPAAFDFTNASAVPVDPAWCDVPPQMLGPGRFRLGDPALPVDARMVVGHCHFASDDAALLVSLLPQLVHVRGETRLAQLVALLNDETHADRPARGVVLAHLLEVMLIEALRSRPAAADAPGLLRGLGDDRVAIALRLIHDRPSHGWTVGDLAQAAALSRSTFFDRFRRAVGMAPMAYLLHWRMALAKDLLRQGGAGIAAIAERLGYGSASAFAVAFARHVGVPPRAYGADIRGQGQGSHNDRFAAGLSVAF
jgi:AraC-like DNA-binding protein